MNLEINLKKSSIVKKDKWLYCLPQITQIAQILNVSHAYFTDCVTLI